MKKIYGFIAKAAMTANYIYSIAWIKAHHSDKFDYRENSQVHAALVDIAYAATVYAENDKDRAKYLVALTKSLKESERNELAA